MSVRISKSSRMSAKCEAIEISHGDNGYKAFKSKTVVTCFSTHVSKNWEQHCNVLQGVMS